MSTSTITTTTTTVRRLDLPRDELEEILKDWARQQLGAPDGTPVDVEFDISGYFKGVIMTTTHTIVEASP